MNIPQLTDKVPMKTRDKHSKIYYRAFDKSCGRDYCILVVYFMSVFENHGKYAITVAKYC